MWNSCASILPVHFWGMPSGILGLSLLIGFVFFLIKLFTRTPPACNRNKDREDTLKILQVRLAKGQISIDEFNKLKSYL